MVGKNCRNYTLHFAPIVGVAIHEMEEQLADMKNIKRQGSSRK